MVSSDDDESVFFLHDQSYLTGKYFKMFIFHHKLHNILFTNKFLSRAHMCFYYVYKLKTQENKKQIII
jgi:hypothetical protein